MARYLAQLDTADWQEPSEELAAKTAHLKEKLIKLEGEMQRLAAMERLMLASPDQQISLTDPDSRSMATSGRGSGVVGYNVQVAVDTKHHLIVTHEVTNDGSDRAQLAIIACQAKEVLGVDELEAVADRGYYSGEEILACHEAGIAVTLPKPMTSGIEAKGRFGKQDFVYLSDELYLLAGRRLPPAWRYDGYRQLQNGVGVTRLMLSDWATTRPTIPPAVPGRRRVAWVCGRAAAVALRTMAADVAGVAGLEVTVVEVPNEFFGGGISVSGLLAGRDIVARLRTVAVDLAVLPRSAFGFQARETLDGWSPAAIEAGSGVPIALANAAAELLKATLHGRPTGSV